MAAPGISVEVADVDAVHATAVEQGFEIVYPSVTRSGGPAFHAPRAERHETPVGWVLKFRDGKLVSFRAFRESDQALEALGLRE